MAKKKRSNQRIWGVIIILFGLIFASVGAGLTYVAYDFSKRAIATSGVVTDIEVNWSSSSSSNNSSPTYKPTISYFDQKGTPQSGQTFLSSSSYNYAIGTKLRILYDPQSPRSLRMDNWFALWGFNLIFLITGLLIMGGGVALWVFGGRKAVKIETAPAKPTAKNPDYSYSSNDTPPRPTVRRK